MVRVSTRAVTPLREISPEFGSTHQSPMRSIVVVGRSMQKPIIRWRRWPSLGRPEGAALHAVAMFNDNYDFALRMSFFEIADCFSSVAERVASIDNRHYLSGFKKIRQKN